MRSPESISCFFCVNLCGFAGSLLKARRHEGSSAAMAESLKSGIYSSGIVIDGKKKLSLSNSKQYSMGAQKSTRKTPNLGKQRAKDSPWFEG
jgi:hypothetical protein